MVPLLRHCQTSEAVCFFVVLVSSLSLVPLWLGVQVVHLQNGETIGYSKLCICTGAAPKVREVEGKEGF